MARIPTLTRRGDEHDENRDGRVDERDAVLADEREAEREDLRRERAVPARRHAAVEDDAVETEVVEPVVRPRASALATLGLILGVLAAVAVATGVLAQVGVALGLVGALVAVGGVSATARRHIAGRSDALLGLLLSLAAVVFGLLALAGAVTWPDPNTNQVDRLNEWLSTALPWLDWT